MSGGIPLKTLAHRGHGKATELLPSWWMNSLLCGSRQWAAFIPGVAFILEIKSLHCVCRKLKCFSLCHKPSKVWSMIVVLFWCRRVAKRCKIPEAYACSVLWQHLKYGIQMCRAFLRNHFRSEWSRMAFSQQQGVFLRRWIFSFLHKVRINLKKRNIFPFQKCIIYNWCFWILLACKRKTRQPPYNPHLAWEYYHLFDKTCSCCFLFLQHQNITAPLAWGRKGDKLSKLLCSVAFPECLLAEFRDLQRKDLTDAASVVSRRCMSMQVATACLGSVAVDHFQKCEEFVLQMSRLVLSILCVLGYFSSF